MTHSYAELDAVTAARLIDHALQVRTFAYAPYSRFHVGAALLCEDGEIIVGCNIENASYSATICAERVAVGSAVAGAKMKWRAIAVSSPGGVTPCGVCRQFLSEFGQDLIVLCVDANTRNVKQYRLSELLPNAFDNSSLPG